jgi:PrcB C-terminal
VRSEDDLVDPRIEAPSNVIERLRREKAKQYARALGVPVIDFERQMVVGVSAGVQPTEGYRVEIARVEGGRDGKPGTTVVWRLLTPPADQQVAQALTHPAEVVLVENREGPVEFRRLADAPR